MAELSLDADAYDAATSLAVSAAINAADALVLLAGEVPPRGMDHSQATTVLRKTVGGDASRQLAKALSRKSKAQYDLKRCTKVDAEDTIKAASRLLTKSKGQQ